jgi:hypothetical protein
MFRGIATGAVGAALVATITAAAATNAAAARAGRPRPYTARLADLVAGR